MWPFDRKPDVERLAARGDVPGLVAALSAGDRKVVDAAVAALAGLSARGVTDALAVALAGGCGPAARALAARGDRAGLPAVVAALGAGDDWLRQAAQAALPALATVEEVGRIAAGDPRTDARIAALRALARMAPADLDARLKAASGDPDPGVAAAARHLRHPGGTRARMAVPDAITALGAPDPQIRQRAAEDLGHARAREAVPALVAAVGRGEWAAARALGQVGDRAAVPVLVAALDDPRTDGVAAEALGELGDPSALPALRAFLARQTPRPRPGGEAVAADFAREAIFKLTGGP